MALFGTLAEEVVTSYHPAVTSADRTRGGGGAAGLNVTADSGRAVDLADQFVVYQVSGELKGPTILEASQVDPKIKGSAAEPDVLSVLEMLSFHVSAAEEVERDTCATLRVNFGKDESSSNKTIDTVFWAVASGLRLYDQWSGKRSQTEDLKADFHKAFGNRPIEIPGGLGKLSFEVVKHEEPPWWRKLLGFGTSDAAKRLVSVLGFPAITLPAIGIIDELLERLSDSKSEVLFRSVPMRLALSGWARDQFTGGNPRIRMGVLNPGFCVLARGRDYGTIAGADALYYPQFDKLAPADVDANALLAGRYEDPFRDITYAVFRVGMRATKIDPTFNFSA